MKYIKSLLIVLIVLFASSAYAQGNIQTEHIQFSKDDTLTSKPFDLSGSTNIWLTARADTVNSDSSANSGGALPALVLKWQAVDEAGRILVTDSMDSILFTLDTAMSVDTTVVYHLIPDSTTYVYSYVQVVIEKPGTSLVKTANVTLEIVAKKEDE